MLGWFIVCMIKPRLRNDNMENKHLREAVKSHKLLAQERTILANERNTLAYIRTGFASFVLGVALIRLFNEDMIFVYGGFIAVLIGALFIIFGFVYYPIRNRKIKSY